MAITAGSAATWTLACPASSIHRRHHGHGAEDDGEDHFMVTVRHRWRCYTATCPASITVDRKRRRSPPISQAATVRVSAAEVGGNVSGNITISWQRARSRPAAAWDGAGIGAGESDDDPKDARCPARSRLAATQRSVPRGVQVAAPASAAALRHAAAEPARSSSAMRTLQVTGRQGRQRRTGSRYRQWRAYVIHNGPVTGRKRRAGTFAQR